MADTPDDVVYRFDGKNSVGFFVNIHELENIYYIIYK
jgi:hypothetical protein